MLSKLKEEIRNKGVRPPDHPIATEETSLNPMLASHTTKFEHESYLAFEECGTCVCS